MLGGPPRRDPTDQRVFNDEPSESMEKLQKLETEKTKKMEQTEAALKDELKKEKRRVEEYEQEEKKLQKDIQSLKQDAKALKQEGRATTKEDRIVDQSPVVDEDEKVQSENDSKPAEHAEPTDQESSGGHEYLAQSRIIAPPYLEPARPEDEIPVAVATTQEQWRRQRIAKDQVQVAQDQMQLAKDSRVLAEGQNKLTNLRTPGVQKEELLAEQVRDQKRIALDQELLVQSQKRLAEDMDSAIDGKLRWDRLEDYRKKRIEKFQDMVNDKLDRLYKSEIDFVKRGRKGKLRGTPLEIPDYGPIGLRVVSGTKAELATGGSDGSEVFQESKSPEEAAEEEAIEHETSDQNQNVLQDQPVVHSGMACAGPLCWFRWFLSQNAQKPKQVSMYPMYSAYLDFFPCAN